MAATIIAVNPITRIDTRSGRGFRNDPIFTEKPASRSSQQTQRLATRHGGGGGENGDTTISRILGSPYSMLAPVLWPDGAERMDVSCVRNLALSTNERHTIHLWKTAKVV